MKIQVFRKLNFNIFPAPTKLRVKWIRLEKDSAQGLDCDFTP